MRLFLPGGSSTPALRSATTTLTAAQIRAIHTTPVQLLPAPGAGLLIVPINLVLILNFGTVAFGAQGTDSLELLYSGGTPQAVSPVGTAFIEQTASSFGLFTFQPNGPWPFTADGVNKALLITDAFDYNAGGILTSTLAAGGTGYVANDTGIISSGNFDATYKVLTIGAGGAVATYQLTSGGTSYLPANGVATATGGAQPGVGVNFTVNITAVTQGDGTVKVVTYYQVLAVP